MTKSEIVKDLLDKAGYGERTDVSVTVSGTPTGKVKVVLRREEGTSRYAFMEAWLELQFLIRDSRFQEAEDMYQPAHDKATMKFMVADE